MAQLVDSLREHMLAVDRDGSAPAIDLARHRAHLLRRLEELEASNPKGAERTLHRWNERFDAFVRGVAAGIRSGIGHGADEATIATMIDTAIDLELDPFDETWSAAVSGIRRKELSAIASRAWSAGEDREIDMDRYVFEIRLVHDERGVRRITRLGRAWLATPGEDAIRFLLAIEAAQSSGRWDRYRLHRASAERMVRAGKGWLPDDPDGAEDWPAAWTTLRRLERLELLELGTDHSDGFREEFFELTERGKRLLGELVSDDDAWTLVARALVAEERGASIQSLVPAFERIQRQTAGELSAREARLVAHEVRNALAPVRVQLDRLYSSLARAVPAFDLGPFRTGIDAGVTRIFEFVEARLNIAKLIEATSEVFELDRALLDAIDSDVETALAAGSTKVRGPRSSFVILVGELLRNARASAERTVRVRIASASSNEHAVVTVDDDGPGIPPSDRERVFDRGFSTRGGSGQGLALAREVVESMGGSIAVEAGPLGGARLTVSLPSAPISEEPR